MNDQDVPGQNTESPTPLETAPAVAAQSASYRVLARKYRPVAFSGLIGQEAMVTTLTNAIRSGRLAHAYMLTGVRGVGKTTTARIIARALNCTGIDAGDGPTPEPCGECENCQAIAEDRHMDVLEMDAASRTGVDDIRELIEGVRYRPVSARFKIYIIDEVHMLSKNAFNALLKTLEEPPEHVKFIFATTEIRKVPVTVLSRCQRFDLRRIDADDLAAHFTDVAAQENVDVSVKAIRLIAVAADGSARDGLSLLDQAIAHGEARVDEEQIRSMLGLADRTATFDILDAVFKGDIGGALALMTAQYEAGADPVIVLRDLLDLVHWLTRVKVVPQAAENVTVPEVERVRGREMSENLSMASLTRGWQMLLKGIGEVMTAPVPFQAAEMLLIRLAYAAELPTPAEAVQAVADGSGKTANTPPSGAEPQSPEAPSGAPSVGASPGALVGSRASSAVKTEPVASPAPEAQALVEPATPDPHSFDKVVELADSQREAILAAHLKNNLHLVQFEPGRIEFRPGAGAPPDLANMLSRFLNETTERRWVVTVSKSEGDATLQQQSDAKADAVLARARRDPLVEAVMTTFPGAKIKGVRSLAADEPGLSMDDLSSGTLIDDD